MCISCLDMLMKPSMCSVFAESEVISLIANNKEKADIADGVCHAIANKASGLWQR